jgi:RPA family protein
MPERMTAKKVKIADIAAGEWVQQDGMEPSYVVAKTGERVSRARILATIVSKFLSEDGNFGSVTIDDGSDTMRAKCFKDMTPLQKAESGQLVDLIGKVREYNGEIYVMPEVVKQVADPNMLLLRKLELAKRSRELEKSGVHEEAAKKDAISEKNEAGKASPSASQDKPSEAGGSPAVAKPAGDDLRKTLLDVIGASKDGIEYAALIEKSGQPEDKVDAVVNELLAEGICYEPTPGKIRKI